MSLNLPRLTLPPGVPGKTEIEQWAARVVAEIERDARDSTTPAKATIAMSNVAAPTTTIDASTATLTDALNFLGGVVNSLIQKGILRTKAGAS